MKVKGRGKVNMPMTRPRMSLPGVSEQTSFNNSCTSQVKWLMTLCPQKWAGIAMIGINDIRKALAQVSMANCMQTLLFIMMM